MQRLSQHGTTVLEREETQGDGARGELKDSVNACVTRCARRAAHMTDEEEQHFTASFKLTDVLKLIYAVQG